MGDHLQPGQGPVTIIVSRIIKPGRESEFEALVRDVTGKALQFEGHLGIEVIRPTNPARPEYVLIFRFSSYENLKRWEDSEVRQEWLAHIRPLMEGEAHIQRVTGMEFWFTPSVAAQRPAPPRYKQMLVAWLAIFPVSTALTLALRPVLDEIPFLARGVLISGMMVVLMTYLVMPFMTRLFARWLYRSAAHTD